MKRETIAKFVNSHGYEILEKQGITAAAKATGLSRPTVYAILKKHPEKPSRIIPKYVEEFEGTLGAKQFLAKNRNRIRTWKKHYHVGLVAYRILEKRAPENWSTEDYRRLWHHERFRDPVTGKIRSLAATSLRLWMKAMDKRGLLQMDEFSTKGLARPKTRKTWYLEDENITLLIEATHRHDLLLIMELGIKSGGRIDSILGIRPLDCNFEKNIIAMYESKTQDYRPRFFDQGCMNRVKQYIQDYNIALDKPLFPSYSTIRKALKATAEEAGIPQLASMRGATHIFKHTFVTQGAFHGLSIEVVAEQTGTTPNTLQSFYVGVKEEKLRRELLGEKLPVLPFHEWIQTFEPLWSQQYNSIPILKKEKAAPAAPKPAKKREINWAAIKALVENPRTPEPIRKYWIRKLEEQHG